jgi:hypothetical protein
MTHPDGTPALDRAVRLQILRAFVDTARAPSVGETARALGEPADEVAGAYRRLAEGRAIVLRSGGEPNDPAIRMAAPFSAVPTRYAVTAGGRRYWANCVWDALGVPAMLGVDARIEATCPDCDEPLALAVVGGELVEGEGVVHFAVPARRWWEDIVFT